MKRHVLINKMICLLGLISSHRVIKQACPNYRVVRNPHISGILFFVQRYRVVWILTIKLFIYEMILSFRPNWFLFKIIVPQIMFYFARVFYSCWDFQIWITINILERSLHDKNPKNFREISICIAYKRYNIREIICLTFLFSELFDKIYICVTLWTYSWGEIQNEIQDK